MLRNKRLYYIALRKDTRCNFFYSEEKRQVYAYVTQLKCDS